MPGNIITVNGKEWYLQDNSMKGLLKYLNEKGDLLEEMEVTGMSMGELKCPCNDCNKKKTRREELEEIYQERVDEYITLVKETFSIESLTNADATLSGRLEKAAKKAQGCAYALLATSLLDPEGKY